MPKNAEHETITKVLNNMFNEWRHSSGRSSLKQEILSEQGKHERFLCEAVTDPIV